MASLAQDFDGYDELWKMSISFVAPMALKVAISLGIPDILADSPKTLDQIVSQLPLKQSSNSSTGFGDVQQREERSREYLARLLRLMVASGVFREREGDGAYENTRLSKWLVRGSTFCLAPYVVSHLEMAFFQSFDHLAAMILGIVPPGCAFEAANGGAHVWDFCQSRRDYGHLFNDAMAALSRRIMETVLASYNGFSGLSSIVDVGGGLGLCMNMVSKAYPGIRAVNFDLPSVVSSAQALPGVEHVGGDMFEHVPEADGVFMKAIMHDWNDEQCKRILSNCFEALPKGGKLIIVEIVVDASRGAGPLMDVLMMAVTKGKERTRGEWFKLLESVNFEKVQILEMPMPWSLIEAAKAS